MSQQLRRPSFFPARDPEYIRIEEDETTQAQVQEPQNVRGTQSASASAAAPHLRNVAKGDPMKRRADGSFTKADVLNSLVPIHHAQWGGYTPKEILKKSTTTGSSRSLSSSSSSTTSPSSTTTNSRTARGGASSSFSSIFTRPSTARS